MREDKATVLFLIGRSLHGSDRTSAIVTRAPRSGVLYQLAPCCDTSARGSVIQDGAEVQDGSSAVLFVPAEDTFGSGIASVTFYVRDSSGTASAHATLTIDVDAVEDFPHVYSTSESSTSPLTPVFIMLVPFDAEGDLPTLTLAGHPNHGKVFLPTETGGVGHQLDPFAGGGLAPSQIIKQYASDLAGVSSWWPAGSVSNAWRWHPLQTLGPQGMHMHNRTSERALVHL